MYHYLQFIIIPTYDRLHSYKDGPNILSRLSILEDCICVYKYLYIPA